jgi:CrcB protein
VLVLLVERFAPREHLRPFVATGFLGAFTTFSTLAVETDLLVRDGRAGIAAVYSVGSLVAGVVAVAAGMRVARRLPPRSGPPRSRSARSLPAGS